MPSQPAAGDPPAHDLTGRSAAPRYSAADWRLLTRLPRRIVVAAVDAGSDRDLAVAAGLAGLEGIAAGRAFDSELVRAVASAIYAESEPSPADPEAAADGAPGPDGLFGACRAAVRLLAEQADPADSAAYRHWAQSIAARVRRASRGPGDPADDRISAADRSFLDDLGHALDLD